MSRRGCQMADLTHPVSRFEFNTIVDCTLNTKNTNLITLAETVTSFFCPSLSYFTRGFYPPIFFLLQSSSFTYPALFPSFSEVLDLLSRVHTTLLCFFFLSFLTVNRRPSQGPIIVTGLIRNFSLEIWSLQDIVRKLLQHLSSMDYVLFSVCCDSSSLILNN